MAGWAEFSPTDWKWLLSIIAEQQNQQDFNPDLQSHDFWTFPLDHCDFSDENLSLHNVYIH